MQKVIYVITVIFLLGCFNENQNAHIESEKHSFSISNLLGVWNYEIILDPKDSEKLFGVKEGVKIFTEIKGSDAYLDSNLFHAEGIAKMKITSPENQYELQFLILVDGIWNLKDSTIEIATTKGSAAPMDRGTRDIVIRNPTVLQQMKPVVGSKEIIHIQQLTHHVLKYRSENLGQSIVTAFKND